MEGYDFDSYVDSGLLLVDALMASGNEPGAREQFIKLLSEMNTERTDDPRIEARRLLLEGDPRAAAMWQQGGVQDSPFSVEITKAMGDAVDRWGMR